MARRTQFGEEIVEVFLIRLSWVSRGKLVLPQQEPEQHALEHRGGYVAAVIPVWQRGKMDVAINEGFSGRHAPLVMRGVRSALGFLRTQHFPPAVPLRCV